MKIHSFVVLLTLVPGLVFAASRTDSARVGVNRVAAAGQRMPTMTKSISTGNMSVKVDKSDDVEPVVPDNEDVVPPDDSVIDDETGLPETTKSDKTSHGYGLTNIRKVAQKYYGDIDIRQDEKSFTLTVMLIVN